MPKERKPLVAVLMGSDSDYETMQETEKLLDRFDVPYATHVTSAHRAAKRTHRIVEELEERGVRVFIVGAGLAAHLAGAVAAVTTLPVIGVPMASGSLEGVDALYSTVQMPSGVPVATMAIGGHGAKNAAVLAAEIVALQDPKLREKLTAYREEMERSVEEKDRQISGARELSAESVSDAIKELTPEGE
ncbi:MAG: 5-(carboxyamino)imidazole ribonucleotide mutase [Candidatus Eisenbacteria bacterium]|nr:5-(carboxyamino)imidazole ribonucleotide mutase [Candidatus Eisenbacteria bacterium]